MGYPTTDVLQKVHWTLEVRRLSPQQEESYPPSVTGFIGFRVNSGPQRKRATTRVYTGIRGYEPESTGTNVEMARIEMIVGDPGSVLDY